MMVPISTTFAVFGVPSGGEILLVLLVILLLFGSKNLPKMARTLGRTLEEFRRAARDVSDEIMHAEDDESKPPSRLPGSVPKGGDEAAPPEDAKKREGDDT